MNFGNCPTTNPIPTPDQELTHFLSHPEAQDFLDSALAYFFRLCAAQATRSGFDDEPHEIQGILDLHAPHLSRWFLDCEIQAELARIMSEGGEAVEAVRKNKMDDHLPHQLGLTTELADILIRCGDSSKRHDLPLATAIVEKMLYNAGRPKKHGKGS